MWGPSESLAWGTGDGESPSSENCRGSGRPVIRRARKGAKNELAGWAPQRREGPHAPAAGSGPSAAGCPCPAALPAPSAAGYEPRSPSVLESGHCRSEPSPPAEDTRQQSGHKAGHDWLSPVHTRWEAATVPQGREQGSNSRTGACAACSGRTGSRPLRQEAFQSKKQPSGDSAAVPTELSPSPTPVARGAGPGRHTGRCTPTSSSFCWKSLLISSFWAWQCPSSCRAAPSSWAFFSCGTQTQDAAGDGQPGRARLPSGWLSAGLLGRRPRTPPTQRAHRRWHRQRSELTIHEEPPTLRETACAQRAAEQCW